MCTQKPDLCRGCGRLIPILESESKSAHPIIECSDRTKVGHKIIRTNIRADLCAKCVAKKEWRQIKLAERRAAKEEKEQQQAERRTRAKADKKTHENARLPGRKLRRRRALPTRRTWLRVWHLKEVKRLKEEEHALAGLLS